jgi:hypothetical protein
LDIEKTISILFDSILERKMPLVIPPEYGYVIATTIATGFQYSFQAIGVAKLRYAAMTRKYLEKNFSAENEGNSHGRSSCLLENASMVRFMVFLCTYLFLLLCTST